jgi:hypothetical protein
VVDEVHAFAGDDRGWHLLAVLERLTPLIGRPIQRVGLSATVGNSSHLLRWLQRSSADLRPVKVTDIDAQLERGRGDDHTVAGLSECLLGLPALFHRQRRMGQEGGDPAGVECRTKVLDGAAGVAEHQALLSAVQCGDDLGGVLDRPDVVELDEWAVAACGSGCYAKMGQEPAMSAPARATTTERLTPLQAARLERLRYQRRGGERLPGAQGGIFQQKITDAERILTTILYQRRICTRQALSELFEVSPPSEGGFPGARVSGGTRPALRKSTLIRRQLNTNDRAIASTVCRYWSGSATTVIISRVLGSHQI